MQAAFALLTVVFVSGCGTTSAVIDAPLVEVLSRLDRLYPEPVALTYAERQKIPAYRGDSAAYDLEVTRPIVASHQPYVLRIQRSQKLYYRETFIAVESINHQQVKLSIDVHDWAYFRLFNKHRRDTAGQRERLREIAGSHNQQLQLTGDVRE